MSLQLDSKTTALVLIDLQNGIVGRPVQPHSADSVIKASRAMADAFRDKGATVVYVRVDLANLLKLNVDISRFDPNAAPPPASASELVPEAGCSNGDLTITKRQWSAFGGTDLESLLRERGVDTIVLAGIATNYGVESTLRHAVALSFHVVIAEDACSSLNADAHAFTVKNIFPLLSRVRSSQEVIAALD